MNCTVSNEALLNGGMKDPIPALLPQEKRARIGPQFSNASND
jgi:hypothetical protein